MKIAIVGGGIVGAYLYRILSNNGEDVHIYCRKHITKCGISPCAWGTSNRLKELLEQVGFDPEKYILQDLDHIIIDEVEVMTELMTIDKPRLIKDLLGSATINDSSILRDVASGVDITGYERIIDATGVARSFLPSIENDIVVMCTQCRVHSDKPLKSQIKHRGVGYAWCFPLSNDEYHIGCGNLTISSHNLLFDVCKTWSKGYYKICSCGSKIRITSPYYSTPFVAYRQDHIRGITIPVWGVGEAIGCVAPLTGEGIVPGMKSAQILMQHWEDLGAYTQAILKEFKWMQNDRLLIDKIIRAEQILEKHR